MNENIYFNYLNFIGVDPDEKRGLEYYLPLFSGCKNVVDLGCGWGTFVQMLKEKGIDATGVDSDKGICDFAQKHERRVINADVFAYLKDIPAESIDGIFCAHLVEHLNYKEVLKLFLFSYKALKPGGRIVLVTPNVRSLYCHLEAYYRDFGHVSFYHPDLLEFLLEQSDFRSINTGENEAAGLFLFNDIKEELSFDRRLYAKNGKSPYYKKTFNIFKLIRRGIEHFIANYILRSHCRSIYRLNESMLKIIERTDSRFEIYASASKPAAGMEGKIGL